MSAIQGFRKKTNDAGNLESNDKQKVIVEEKVIRVEPANPEVIYIPVYQPSVVIVRPVVPAPVIFWGTAIVIHRWMWHGHRWNPTSPPGLANCRM